MSTNAEKKEAIQFAVDAAKRRLKTLDALKSVGAISRAQEYERDMTLDCIRRGEEILKPPAGEEAP